MKNCTKETNKNDLYTIDDINDTNLIDKKIDMNAEESKFKRTLIVGPSFCGKTHLLINKIQLIRLDNPEQQIKILTRSPQQYTNTALLAFGIQLEDTEGALRVSVDEDVEDKTIQAFQICCVVFDMLDNIYKLTDPFFYRGRHDESEVYYLSQS